MLEPFADTLGEVSRRRTFGLERRIGMAAKRGIDIAVAGTAVVLLLPLLLLVAAAVWMGDGKSPIFRHARLGRDGRTFGCLKFRTMVVDSEKALAAHLASSAAARAEWAATHKLTDDPRVTALGRVLRKTSLDELPQLINVLRGEMSLVGPRPIVQAEVARYGAAFQTCFAVPPGVTGLWQVSGRSDTTYEQRVALDVDYATRWSLRRDIAILARTVPAVFAQRGSR
ncbi:exopolysaccharide production protein ExoY [Methylobacterium persicinum]|uniref:Exopolysaccharide production protein ExoY n=2 Tax=Methylobacterium persicinum TaxID=374426 RepID=A0ABU0HQL1_9HYPH|nr:sugar transferase [Methylobacterium persicinum]MDQ0444600.1 exopolysaccharide production protein ExoY [Methylobacterium persicinum]